MTASIFESISYDAILARLKAEFVQRCPDYNAFLESDPAMKLLEIGAFQEMILRTRIQEAIKSNLLAYATGTDLDNLAAFYSVVRGDGETDEAFRSKIQTRIQGWSPAGSREHYKFHALQADARVKDARADSPIPGLVRIALLSHEDNGQASADLLAKVNEILQSDSIRVLTDTVEVVPCTIQEITVQAKITLYPEALETTVAKAQGRLETAFEQQKSLGWDVSRAWITAHLFTDGIQNIVLESPTADVVVGDDACAALTEIDLKLVGRNW